MIDEESKCQVVAEVGLGVDREGCQDRTPCLRERVPGSMQRRSIVTSARRGRRDEGRRVVRDHPETVKWCATITYVIPHTALHRAEPAKPGRLQPASYGIGCCPPSPQGRPMHLRPSAHALYGPTSLTWHCHRASFRAHWAASEECDRGDYAILCFVEWHRRTKVSRLRQPFLASRQDCS